MLAEIATTAITFISTALYLFRRTPPNPHSVAAIRARLDGEKRVAAALKHEAARLSAVPLTMGEFDQAPVVGQGGTAWLKAASRPVYAPSPAPRTSR